jgi:predicted acylesterase/phospholipase RssA
MSTIAIPGFFAPVKIGKMQLIDGGTLNNLPPRFHVKYFCHNFHSIRVKMAVETS